MDITFSNLQNDTSVNENFIFDMSITFIAVGVFLVIANTPIFLCILWHSELRNKKEYLLLAGLASADLLEGWSTLITGAYRLHLFVSEHVEDRTTCWECAKTPHFILMTFTQVAQAGMLLIISIDRLVALLKPLQYYTFTKKYAVALVGCCYCLAALHTSWLLWYLHNFDDDQDRISAVCFTTDVDMLNTIIYARFALGGLSIVVYVIVCYLFGNYQRKMSARFPSHEVRLRRTQLRVTTTVGICAILTVFCCILPTGLLFTNIDSKYFVMLYWILHSSNAVVNVFVYSLRHGDIRCGLRLLFQCKKMPTNRRFAIAQ